MKLELALLAHFHRQDGLRLRDIAGLMQCSIMWAHHLSRTGEGYLRKLSRVSYLLHALKSLGEPNGRSDL